MTKGADIKKMNKKDMDKEALDQEALKYHRAHPPGKISVTATKPLNSQRDLSLAYSPGVAAACEAIKQDPLQADELTARANLVAVITNGTAVLGLGDIGPLASKPVMEGKGVLFKKFAGIDVFDIEVDSNNADHFCSVVKALEPTFGGVNLEDIKAPECFIIEARLREEMNIPVFHDDQHGTAIITAAGVFNAAEIIGKDIANLKIVCSGAGAAALACLTMLEVMGAKRSNMIVLDRDGVVYKGRNHNMDIYKEKFAADTKVRTLDDAIKGADMFLGLSAAGVMTPEMVKNMAANPLIFALANPEPEIRPEQVHEVRDDAIVATGRSDYANQINNVLCFPFIFRGALDVGATSINEEMKLAAAKAIAALARKEVSESVAAAYGDVPTFGRDYIIPKPFDSRLILEIAPAVAKAAMDTGVARRPITDFTAYGKQLESFVYRSGSVMKPIIDKAQSAPKRVVFAEGEEERVLRAARILVDDKIAFPILIGRKEVIEARIERMKLRLEIGKDFELCDNQQDPRHKEYSRHYQELLGRGGVSPRFADVVMRTRNTAIGAMMVHLGQADSMICGTIGFYEKHLEHIYNIIGTKSGVRSLSTLNMLVLDSGVFFMTDTHVNYDPDVETLAEIARLGAEEVERFGIKPRIAMMSHSNFGSHSTESSNKVKKAVALLQATTNLEIEGEMHADTALDQALRKSLLPNNKLEENANLLVMPNLDAANIAYNCAKALGNGLSIGPIMVGAAKPVHVLTTSATVRNIVNMAALSVVDAQIEE